MDATALKRTPRPRPPHRNIRFVIAAVMALAVLMLLCGVLLTISGSYLVGTVISILALTALGYDIYAAVCYRRRRANLSTDKSGSLPACHP